jgi:hypothetical protein
MDASLGRFVSGGSSVSAGSMKLCDLRMTVPESVAREMFKLYVEKCDWSSPNIGFSVTGATGGACMNVERLSEDFQSVKISEVLTSSDSDSSKVSDVRIKELVLRRTKNYKRNIRRRRKRSSGVPQPTLVEESPKIVANESPCPPLIKSIERLKTIIPKPSVFVLSKNKSPPPMAPKFARFVLKNNFDSWSKIVDEASKFKFDTKDLFVAYIEKVKMCLKNLNDADNMALSDALSGKYVPDFGSDN